MLGYFGWLLMLRRFMLRSFLSFRMRRSFMRLALDGVVGFARFGLVRLMANHSLMRLCYETPQRQK